MTESDAPRREASADKAPDTAAPAAPNPTASEVAPAADPRPEAPTDEAPAPQSPARKIVLITAGVLLAIYVYDVIADRVTPYTSQAAVDTFLVQISPEVMGQVEYVGVTDNRAVRRGDVLFRVDREPFEIAVRSAEALKILNIFLIIQYLSILYMLCKHY